MGHVEDWKNKLIDLSRRNNLLYFRQTKRGTLPISYPDIESIFDRLVLKSKTFEFYLPPEEEDNEEKNEIKISSQQPTVPFQHNQLVSDNYPRKELEKTLKNLRTRSQSDYIERGVRILHASFGMLVWKEKGNAEEIYSPLLLVPIELGRESINDPYTVKVPSVEEEIILNPALQAKLKKDFDITLPPLPEDWENHGLNGYFDTLHEFFKRSGWKVEQAVEIGLFSFHKLVIYKDLSENFNILSLHKLIQAIAGIKDLQLVLDALPEEKEVDKIEKPQQTYQVLDADSSQRTSIEYALRGQSFVMQGPPGTGKSQTIANIIAECIARGKTVLFVSDKMAALDVVHKRLNQVKLSSFCLELHSSKANKREVVNELKRCLEQQEHARNLPSNLDFEKMQSMRENLNNYVISLHETRTGLERSVYQVLGSLSKLETIPFVPIELSDVASITPKRLSYLEGLVTQLKNVWQVAEEQNFPWKGYKGTVYNLQIRMELIALLDGLLRTMDKLNKEAFKISAELGLDEPTTIDRVRWLVSITQLLSDTLKPEKDWMVKSDLDSLINESENNKKFFEWRSTKRSYLSDKYADSLYNLSIYTSSTLTNQLNDLKSLIKLQRPEEEDLLSKRQEIIDFLSFTSDCSEIWLSDFNELALNFGFPTDGINIDQVKRLAQIAIECFSQDKPETRLV